MVYNNMVADRCGCPRPGQLPLQEVGQDLRSAVDGGWLISALN